MTPPPELCDCGHCHVCDLQGTAKPLPKSADIVPSTWVDPHEPVKAPKPKKPSKSDRPGGLFDE